MNNEKDLIQISKFLSMVLRHQPETIGIEFDKNGWADVAILIEKSNSYGVKLDMETLKLVVADNSKKRFAFNDTLDKIRASQGHSVNVALGYTSQKPLPILYHGTNEKSVQSILSTGIEKRSRRHVHLSKDIETAIQVGQRHGKPIVFKVKAEQMYRDKYEFFLSDNGVWLTDNVPPKYLERAADADDEIDAW